MTHDKQQSQKIVKKSSGKGSQKLHFPWLFIVVLAIALFVGSRAWGMLEKRASAREMNDAYRNELAELSQKEADMNAELADLTTPEGVEREIREKFRVTKVGEELVVVVPPADRGVEQEDDTKGLFHFLKALFTREKDQEKTPD